MSTLQVPCCTYMLERNIFHDCHHEYRAPLAPSGCWADVGWAWRTKTLWLVRRSWPHPIGTRLRETGLQAGMAMDDASHCGRSWRRPLRCAGLFNSPWCCRHSRHHGYGDVQEPLEKWVLVEQRW